MALKDNLVAYWPLDEASGTRTDVHGSHNLTDNNSVLGASGKINNGADFEEASDQRLSRADSAQLSTGDIDFTFTAWVHAESLVDFPPVLSKWLTGGLNPREFNLFHNDSTSRFNFQVTADGTLGTVTTVAWSATASTATWYFIVVWHDATNNQIGIMVNNGTAVTASHSGGVFDGDATFEIGGQSGGAIFWDGLIDEVGFWKRLLTSEEKTELYNGGAGLSYDDFDSGGGGGPLVISRTVLDYDD